MNFESMSNSSQDAVSSALSSDQADLSPELRATPCQVLRRDSLLPRKFLPAQEDWR
jgi:hypothetical protein